MIKLLKLLLLFTFLFNFNYCTKKDYIKIIDAKELKNLLNKDIILIDNRPSFKFKEGHIKTALNLVYFEENAEENTLDINFFNKLPKSKILVFYCTGFNRAYNASMLALNLGFKKVYWFKGGMLEWQANNFEIEN
jgi:rhodanese-related sulfurtransferase